jgi:hypothetical protein
LFIFQNNLAEIYLVSKAHPIAAINRGKGGFLNNPASMLSTAIHLSSEVHKLLYHSWFWSFLGLYFSLKHEDEIFGTSMVLEHENGGVNESIQIRMRRVYMRVEEVEISMRMGSLTLPHDSCTQPPCLHNYVR